MSTPTPIKVVVSKMFVTASNNLCGSQQSKIRYFIAQIKKDPKILTRRIKVNEVIETYLYSVDEEVSAVIFKPHNSHLIFCMWVGCHDDATQWGMQYDFYIHAETGSLQLINTAETQQVSPIPEPSQQQSSMLFSAYSAEQLSALGTPDALLAKVMAFSNQEALEEAQTDLPAEVFEALIFLAVGESFDEVLSAYNKSVNEKINQHDFETALTKLSSAQFLTLVEDDEELEKMLAAPLEQWRVFLHPTQRSLVEMHAKGPVRVLGGAGTGKTVVAMHRAVFLAEQLIQQTQTHQRILLTTFTSILASDIRTNLKKIATAKQLELIEVINIDAWVLGFLSNYQYDYRIVHEDNEITELCWHIALEIKPQGCEYPDSFYKEEWRHVIQQLGVRSLNDYFMVTRKGRGITLNRIQRAKIWVVFQRYRELLERNKLKEMNDAFQDMLDCIKTNNIQLPYSSIIVDESQDMGAAAFSLLRNAVPEKENDLFIIGDGRQRIYRNKVVLGRVGISIKGKRSKKLTVNYRTTEETRRFANAIFNGVQIDNLDQDIDQQSAEFSIIRGAQPSLKIFKSAFDEMQFIYAEIQSLMNKGIALKDICIVVKNKTIRAEFEHYLISHQLNPFILRKDAPDAQHDGVRLSTIYRVKGLEFGYIFLASINDNLFQVDADISDDPIEIRDREFNQKALLHVAATRAVKHLYVSASDKPCRFIFPNEGY